MTRATCPHCGEGCVSDLVDGPHARARATSIFVQMGDARAGSVCIHCAGVIVFTDDRGGVRAGSLDEFSGAARQTLRHLIRLVELSREQKEHMRIAQERGRDIERMVSAARQWLRAHPMTELRFADMRAKAARAAGVRLTAMTTLVAALDVELIHDWGKNTATRDLLRVLDTASGGRATYQMAVAALTGAGLKMDGGS